MRNKESIMKVRTTEEISIFLQLVGGAVLVVSVISLFFVKSVLGAVLILALPAALCTAIFFLLRRYKNAFVMNAIDYKGVRNEYFGGVICELEWAEIGDIGVACVRRGLFKGEYIYMSRIFVSSTVRNDIINQYDPRICILLPYTKETCAALREASGEKIDIE